MSREHKKNDLHRQRLERLHRLDHVVRHGILMRGSRRLQHAWHHSEEEQRARGLHRLSGLEKVRRAMGKLSGLQSINVTGFDGALRFCGVILYRESACSLRDHDQHGVVLRQRMRLHAARISRQHQPCFNLLKTASEPILSGQQPTATAENQ